MSEEEKSKLGILEEIIEGAKEDIEELEEDIEESEEDIEELEEKIDEAKEEIKKSNSEVAKKKPRDRHGQFYCVHEWRDLCTSKTTYESNNKHIHPANFEFCIKCREVRVKGEIHI